MACSVRMPRRMSRNSLKLTLLNCVASSSVRSRTCSSRASRSASTQRVSPVIICCIQPPWPAPIARATSAPRSLRLAPSVRNAPAALSTDAESWPLNCSPITRIASPERSASSDNSPRDALNREIASTLPVKLAPSLRTASSFEIPSAAAMSSAACVSSRAPSALRVYATASAWSSSTVDSEMPAVRRTLSANACAPSTADALRAPTTPSADEKRASACSWPTSSWPISRKAIAPPTSPESDPSADSTLRISGLAWLSASIVTVALRLRVMSPLVELHLQLVALGSVHHSAPRDRRRGARSDHVLLHRAQLELGELDRVAVGAHAVRRLHRSADSEGHPRERDRLEQRLDLEVGIRALSVEGGSHVDRPLARCGHLAGDRIRIGHRVAGVVDGPLEARVTTRDRASAPDMADALDRRRASEILVAVVEHRRECLSRPRAERASQLDRHQTDPARREAQGRHADAVGPDQAIAALVHEFDGARLDRGQSDRLADARRALTGSACRPDQTACLPKSPDPHIPDQLPVPCPPPHR